MSHRVLNAAEHGRRMRGGSQPHLLRASDDLLYVVKFIGNPQGSRVLVNEWIATHLAQRVGLPVPVMRAIDVSEELISATPELRFELPHGCTPCPSGVQCASKYLAVPGKSELFDVMPQSLLSLVGNHEIFCAALVFDAWLGNTDYRQFVFKRKIGSRGYTAFMIDQGDCFNRTKWNFPDLPTQLALTVTPLKRIRDCGTLEPWITAIESITADDVERAASGMPDAWTHGQTAQLETLLKQIVKRTRVVRTLLARGTAQTAIRSCAPNACVPAFPN